MLEVDQAHGLALPDGVAAHDHLTLADRRAVDEASVAALRGWRGVREERLTFDGLRLPWAWEAELLGAIAIPTVRDAAGVRAAVAAIGAERLVPAAGGVTTAIVAAAAGDAAVSPPDRAGAAPPPRWRPIAGDRWRRRAGALARRVGAPGRLRTGSVLLVGYGSTVPLLDRLLGARAAPVGMPLLLPPPGLARVAAVARSGGWVGLPGPRARARAAAETARALERWEAPVLDVLGMPLGPVLDAQIVAVARERAAADLAAYRVAVRALDRARPRRLVLPFDVVPEARVLIAAARATGVPSLLVQHGIPGHPTIVDGREADAVAVWSEEYLAWLGGDREAHVTGYPFPAQIAERPPRPIGSDARVLVLAQAQERATATMDARLMLRHFDAAVIGVRAALPRATVVLRPHPSHDSAPGAALAAAHGPGVEVDSSRSIADLFAHSDLCIGALSTATAQAGLAGVPVVVLNLTGADWPWPLGGDTRVPVARSASELAERIAGLAPHGRPAGRDDLLAVLGVARADPDRLQRLAGAR